MYTGNNPVNYVDPTGHARESVYDNNGGNWTPEYEKSKPAPPRARNVVNKIVAIANDTTPPLSKYGMPEIPTTAQLVNKGVEIAINNVFPEVVTSNVLNSINATFDKVGNLERKVGAYLAPDGYTISHFAPSGSLDTMNPYGRLTKVGTAMTMASNFMDIANTWTADSGNTNIKRLLKTSIQIGGMSAAGAWGGVTGSMALAMGFVAPATGGLSVAGVFVAGTIDVAGAAGINWTQEQLYKITGIK